MGDVLTVLFCLVVIGICIAILVAIGKTLFQPIIDQFSGSGKRNEQRNAELDARTRSDSDGGDGEDRVTTVARPKSGLDAANRDTLLFVLMFALSVAVMILVYNLCSRDIVHALYNSAEAFSDRENGVILRIISLIYLVIVGLPAGVILEFVPAAVSIVIIAIADLFICRAIRDSVKRLPVAFLAAIGSGALIGAIGESSIVLLIVLVICFYLLKGALAIFMALPDGEPDDPNRCDCAHCRHYNKYSDTCNEHGYRIDYDDSVTHTCDKFWR